MMVVSIVSVTKTRPLSSAANRLEKTGQISSAHFHAKSILIITARTHDSRGSEAWALLKKEKKTKKHEFTSLKKRKIVQPKPCPCGSLEG